MKKLFTTLIAAVMAFALSLPSAAFCAPTSTYKQSQAAAGAGGAVPVVYRPGSQPPSIMCAVSSGGSMTYDIEVTGDQPDANGGYGVSATWFKLDSSAIGLTAASVPANFPIVSLVTAVRVNVTSYSGGTLTYEVVQ